MISVRRLPGFRDNQCHVGGACGAGDTELVVFDVTIVGPFSCGERGRGAWLGGSYLYGQLWCEHAGRNSPVGEHVGAGDEPCCSREQELRDGGDVADGSDPPGWGVSDHGGDHVAGGWVGEFGAAHRRSDDAGADRIDSGATGTPPRGGRRHPELVAAFGDSVGHAALTRVIAISSSRTLTDGDAE